MIAYMKTLRTYLNSLAPPDQVVFAQHCGTTVGYLRKMLSEGGPVREKLCAAIERHSDGAVSRKELRPDDWRDIWPELENSKPNSPPALTAQGSVAMNSNIQGAAHA